MSLATCKDCGRYVDTDEGDAYPYAFAPGAPESLQDICLCPTCKEDRIEAGDHYLTEESVS
jgi:rubredoxin